MKKQDLIKAIEALDKQFIEKTGISFLSQFTGWKRMRLSYIKIIKEKLEKSLEKFNKKE